MNNKSKIWLILATILVILGTIIFGIAMSMHGWDFSKLSTVKYETNVYEINEELTDVSIDADISDIMFLPSTDDTCKVICYEMEKVKHDVVVVDKKLTIKANDERKWFDYINILFESPKITVYIPNNSLESLNLDGTTGDLDIENLSIKLINISITTGDITLNNINCDALSIENSTGDITINNTNISDSLFIDITTGDIKINNASFYKLDINVTTGDTELINIIVIEDCVIECTTGDVTFDSLDAKNIYVTTTTGDVEGTIVTEKIFNVQSNTGKISVPDSYSGGVCKIKTTTGDIIISYKK